MTRLFLIPLAGVLACIAVPALAQQAPKVAPAQTAQKAAQNTVPDTLMFTIDEFNDIQSHLAGATSSTNDNSAIENASLYLSTIVYVGPNDWTVWINGLPIGPHDEFQSFKVTSISPNAVELLVPLSAQGMRPVKLGPNQTFVTRSGIVVEGHVQ